MSSVHIIILSTCGIFATSFTYVTSESSCGRKSDDYIHRHLQSTLLSTIPRINVNAIFKAVACFSPFSDLDGTSAKTQYRGLLNLFGHGDDTESDKLTIESISISEIRIIWIYHHHILCRARPQIMYCGQIHCGLSSTLSAIRKYNNGMGRAETIKPRYHHPQNDWGRLVIVPSPNLYSMNVYNVHHQPTMASGSTTKISHCLRLKTTTAASKEWICSMMMIIIIGS